MHKSCLLSFSLSRGGRRLICRNIYQQEYLERNQSPETSQRCCKHSDHRLTASHTNYYPRLSHNHPQRTLFGALGDNPIYRRKSDPAEINQGDFAFLFVNQLLLVAHGTVIAGVDLEKLKPEDMQLVGSVLNVRLPDTEVFIATLDNDKTYVFECDTGALRSPDQNLETQACQSAEQEICKAAIEDGILDIARQNAETYLSYFFLTLGYADVIFVERMP